MSGLNEVTDYGTSGGPSLRTTATINTGDIEIGAVEIKNATNDTRATVDADGLYVNVRRFPSVTTATLTNVSDAATSTSLSTSNPNRKGWYVTNDSSSILYINFGATASTTAYTVQVAAGGFYEMPLPVYTGAMNGIWSADSTGAARITELS